MLLVLVVCAGTAACAQRARPVALGAIYDVSGALAALDGPSARGARLAADEAESAGGVLARPVELTIVDGESSTSVVRTRSEELLARRPAAVLGLSDTDMVLAAAPPVAASGRVFLTSGATSPLLPAEVPDWLFLACFTDDVQAAAAAEWTFDARGARSAAVLYSAADRYTDILQQAFRARFTELGGRVATVLPYAPATFDPRTLDALAPADVIFLAAQPDDAIAVTRALRAHGVTTPIVGGDAFDSDAWIAYPELGDVFFTTHAYVGADSTDPRVRAFRAAYAASGAGGEPDAFTALGYDAARLLLDAVRRAGSDEPQRLRAALAATHDFPGVTGDISYRAGARVPIKPVTIVALDAGRRRFVAQLVPRGSSPS